MTSPPSPREAFQALFDHSLDAVLFFNEDHSIAQANPAACALFLMNKEDICCGPLQGLFNGTDTRLLQLLDELKRFGKARGEIICRRQDGGSFVAEASFARLADHEASLVILRDLTERNNLVEALRQSEQRLRTLTDNNTDVVGRFDRQHRHLYLSPSAELLTSRPTAEFIGKSARELGMPGDICDRLEESQDRAFAGEHVTMEFAFTDPDGRKRHMWDQFIPEFGSDGSVTSVLALGREITDLVEAQTALQTSEMRFKRIAAAVPDVLYVSDIRTREMLYINNAITRTIGYTPEEVIAMGHGLFNLFHPDDRDGVIASFKELERLSDGEVVETEFRILHKDGSYRWLRARDVAFTRDADGSLQQCLGSARDITEQRNTEEMLREAKERVEKLVEERTVDLRDKKALLRTILETLPIGLTVIGENGTMTYANRGFAEIWERPVMATIEEYSQNYPIFRHGTNKQITIDEYPSRLAINSGHEQHGLIFDIVTCSGARKTIRTSSAPVRLPSGSGIGAIVVVEDITDQQELQKQLLHAQKLDSIGSLAGGVAHDFNNLLMAICGFTEVVYMELEDDDLRDHLHQVLVAGERARELTHKLLAVSRQQVTETKVISLTAAVEGVIRLMRRTLREDIEVRTRLATLPLNIIGSASQIEQVLMNIVINAGDAMPHGGILEITTGTSNVAPGVEAKKGAWTFVKVSDNGYGIPRHYIEKIFDPYFTTKEIGKGTGLGLAIAYGIVQQHQGLITVDSTEGEGTTFAVYLPLTGREPGRAAAPVTLSDMNALETVLVVEDDDTVRTFIRSVLGKSRYNVFVAADAEEALEIVASHPVDVVFSDVIMPKMNGVEMYYRMKELRPDLKIIFASGYSSDIMTTKGLRENEFRFLQKPVSGETLLRTIREVVEE